MLLLLFLTFYCVTAQWHWLSLCCEIYSAFPWRNACSARFRSVPAPTDFFLMISLLSSSFRSSPGEVWETLLAQYPLCTQLIKAVVSQLPSKWQYVSEHCLCWTISSVHAVWLDHRHFEHKDLVSEDITVWCNRARQPWGQRSFFLFPFHKRPNPIKNVKKGLCWLHDTMLFHNTVCHILVDNLVICNRLSTECRLLNFFFFFTLLSDFNSPSFKSNATVCIWWFVFHVKASYIEYLTRNKC